MAQPEPVSSEWDAPAEAPGGAAGRAAAWVWTLGVLEIVVFGLCTAGIIALATAPAGSLETVAAERGMTAEQLRQLRQALLPGAVVAIALGLLPGGAYLALGLGVRRRSVPATSLALMLVMTQAIVVGVLLIWGVAMAVRQRDPAQLTGNLLLLGTPLALLGCCARWLLRARGAIEPADNPPRDEKTR